MSSSVPTGGAGGPRRPTTYRFDRSQRERPVNPRTVRQGVKLAHELEEIRGNWLAARWLALIEQVAPKAALAEGLEYARLGQTRRLQFEPGRVIAPVQGRDPKSYTTTLSVPRLTEEQWDGVARVLAEQAVYGAKILAGTMPEGIGEALDEAGLAILPATPEHMTARCTCREEIKPWCKHACCVAILLADRLVDLPLTVFTLRGLEGEAFLERLREQRAFAGGGKATPGVYSPRIPKVSEMRIGTLEERASRFWEMDPALSEMELPVTAPEVSHPLLRRLGTSPFAGARFPLVGLLATCYEVVSEAVLKAERGEGAEEDGRMGSGKDGE